MKWALQLTAEHGVRWIIGAFVVAMVGAAAFPRASLAAPKAHETPRAYCARIRNDDALRAPPASLAPAIRRLFNMRGPYALKSTYYRCAGGRVLVCWIGNDLPCGKANIKKRLPAATRWCRAHPNSDFIPLVVTGHDTLYSWRCVGHTAKAGAPVGALDARGFFVRYWKKL
jgi:hypothetical protein